jgi:Rad3-related DNA helicase
MAKVKDIFPYEVPSAPQQKLMEELIRDYNRYDVFLINAPVAFGKSGVAKAIMNLAEYHGNTANWIVPNNALVRQGTEEFGLSTIYKKSMYDSPAAHREAKDIVMSGQSIMNYYTLLANKTYKHTLIIDEAHSIISMLQDMEGAKYWDTEKDFPTHLTTASDALIWMATRQEWDAKAAKMVKAMQRHPNQFTISYEWGELNKKQRRCLRVYPLSPKNNRPILWPPSRTKKIFLMSATISESEIAELGLDDRRVKYYEAASVIPPDNRPAILYPLGSMSYYKSKDTLDKVEDFIYYCLENEKGKGFIHATYGVAARLRARLNHPRLMYHTKDNKAKQFEKWVASKDGVFIGAGMTEGINLKGKLASWQIVTKCPFPSLADPAIRAKKDLDEKWYVWVTIRDVLQAYGRVCRGPEDYGKTFIVDSAFTMLYNKHRDLFPDWFKESVR